MTRPVSHRLADLITGGALRTAQRERDDALRRRAQDPLLPAVLAAVRRLPGEWLDDVSRYPDHAGGRIGAAAVRCCADELDHVLAGRDRGFATTGVRGQALRSLEDDAEAPMDDDDPEVVAPPDPADMEDHR